MIILLSSYSQFPNLFIIILIQTFKKEIFTHSSRQSAPLNLVLHYSLYSHFKQSLPDILIQTFGKRKY